MNLEQLKAIAQFIKSPSGQIMLEKLAQAVSDFTKKISLKSSASNSPNHESTKKPFYSKIHAKGSGIKPTSLKFFWLGLLLGLAVTSFRHPF